MEKHRLMVFENRLLSIFDEVTGGLKVLHNEKFHNLHSPSSIIRMTKSRKMRWEGHVARIEKIGIQRVGGKPRRKETTKKTKT
jgi:hypothetical protein